MDHDDDVERLFSWIKTPDLRYREFAGEREVADAVATWPALRKTADETGRADDASAEPAPAAEPEPPPPAASGRSPLGERLASIFGQQRDPAVPQAEPCFAASKRPSRQRRPARYLGNRRPRRRARRPPRRRKSAAKIRLAGPIAASKTKRKSSRLPLPSLPRRRLPRRLRPIPTRDPSTRSFRGWPAPRSATATSASGLPAGPGWGRSSAG